MLRAKMAEIPNKINNISNSLNTLPIVVLDIKEIKLNIKIAKNIVSNIHKIIFLIITSPLF